MVDADRQRGALLVSSEPLSEDAGWDAVPPNHLVLLRRDSTVEVRPVELETGH
jgi:predicted glutamine amidotransferase